MTKNSETRGIYGRNEDGTVYFSMGSWSTDRREATRFHKDEVGKIVDYLVEQQKSAHDYRVYGICAKNFPIAVYSADEVLKFMQEDSEHFVCFAHNKTHGLCGIYNEDKTKEVGKVTCPLCKKQLEK